MNAATLLRSPDGLLTEAVEAGRWSDACALAERSLGQGREDDTEQKLLYAVALIRSGRIDRGLDQLDPEVASLPEARVTLRRHVLSWLIREKQFDAAVAVLGRLLDVQPEAVEELRLRGSLFGRTRQFPAALADALRLIELRPDDLDGQAAYLQLLLQDGQVEAAGAYARVLAARAARNPRLARIALLCLGRAGLTENAARLAEAAESAWPAEPEVIAEVARAYWDAGRTEEAIAAGERCVAVSPDAPRLRQLLGHVYRSAMRSDGNARAAEHLGEALRHMPGDANTALLLGEVLLRTGKPGEAAPHLAEACKKITHSANARALLARAYKQNGQHAEAAHEFRQLIALQPGSHRWHRYAAGALSQAGQTAEAADLFDRFTAERERALPPSFEAGLEQLWAKADAADVPAARLDWAWQLRRDRTADRQGWERAAKWGYLADHYLLDWLECRDDQVHEAMSRLADLTAVEQAFAQVDPSRGLILASAHIGAMYAGPLALELLGVKSKWLASTPSVARTSYARSLISTSDQGGTDVARKVLGALGGGNAVVIAVDGAINLAAPRVAFEGQEITYSSFAARMAHRLGIPSMFVAPFWENGQIYFMLERLPDAGRRESADDYADRWRAAYLRCLRQFLGGAPENLRLSGGLWRYVRPAEGTGPRRVHE
ncbi:tetratricopeptide repeat protein [uncultured Sphingomonas sp.]|uniref:tetratricopeptide repeat protein n=1 Tax=uncultured Sphingomonas sp. TaxID=158754 RepID=UPI0025F37A8C|nr:tetratricopeptide repeat protein [uncultured Sphingomonas sp.]